MRLTKYGHACVRLDKDGGGALVIDPGVFSDTGAALDGAGVVLVTHEHPDHVNAEALRSACAADPALRVFAHADVAAALAGVPVTPVEVGGAFDAGGFQVQAFGGLHAEVYGGLPGIANLGFLVDGAVYHPGDSADLPDTPPPVLLVPVSGPWVKLGNMIDMVRNAKPDLAIPIHDAILNEMGNSLVDAWISEEGGAEYRRLNPDEALTI
jgi:L-ascorbate metabolism protein UlaG (beta-lactamase superfamily)